MSVVLIGIAVLVIIVSVIRPQLFKRIFHEFSERKYIAAVSVFVCLLSGTVFIATEPTHDTSFVSENTKTTIHSVDPFDTPNMNEQETIKIEDTTGTAAIPFTKLTKEDVALPSGQTKIVQGGVNGLKEIVYTVTYNNGAEVSRTIKSETVKTPETPEITAVGTYIAPPVSAPKSTAQPQTAPKADKQKNSAQPPAQQPKKNDSICKNSQSWICKQLR